MSLESPKIKWFLEKTPTIEAVEWNAGVVDANNYSLPNDPTQPENTDFPSTFLIWNNKYEADANPTGSSVAVSNMSPVYLTTLSLVYDEFGNVDTANSGQIAGPVGTHVGATSYVQSIFYNADTAEWGTYDETAGAWAANTWKTIGGNTKAKVVAANGTVGVLSGAINSGSLLDDRENYSKVKMRLYVGPNADAGVMTWLTRCSYQYTG